MTVCTKCGAENADGVRFCSGCGAAMEKGVGLEVSRPASGGGVGKSGWSALIIALAVCGVGCLGFIGLLAAIAVPNFREAQTRAKVSRAHADMRSIGVALEAFMIDNDSLPSGPKPEMLGDNALFDREVRESLSALTAPISYITSIPNDPFAPATGTKYRYLQWVDTEGESKGKPRWVLWSLGPDGVSDMPDPRGKSALDLAAYTYDPTNGTKSRGDVIRLDVGSGW